MTDTEYPEIELGRMNILPVVKKVEFGYYLGGSIRGNFEEILLPLGEVTPLGELEGGALEGSVSVFLYLDQEERLVATMRKPLAQVGDFAYLEVSWVNNFGAFLNWGLQKDLFVPFREQKMKMQKGQKYIVHIHLDPESYRIMASAKVEKWFREPQKYPKRGTEVECLVWQKTDIGFKVIMNPTHEAPKAPALEGAYPAVLYDTQIFRQLHTGDVVTAYVSKVREDGKIDVSLQRQGEKGARDFSDVLLKHLQTNGGSTALGDKSPAEEIYSIFGVSKKVFKRAVGELYKKRVVEITDDGIRLIHNS